METLLSISGAEGMSMLNNSNNSNLSKSQGRPRVNMKPKTPLAQRLQLIFRECNFSVAAEKMGGISSKTAKAYMTGDTDPTASVLAAIVTNMGCRSDWLLLGKAPVFPEGYGAGDQVSESSDLFLHSMGIDHASMSIYPKAPYSFRCRWRIMQAVDNTFSPVVKHRRGHRGAQTSQRDDDTLVFY